MRKHYLLLLLSGLLFLSSSPAMCGLDDFDDFDDSPKIVLTAELQQQDTDVIIKAFNELYNKKSSFGKPESVEEGEDFFNGNPIKISQTSWDGIKISENTTASGTWHEISLSRREFNDEGDFAKPKDQYPITNLHVLSSFNDFQTFKEALPKTWEIKHDNSSSDKKQSAMICENSIYRLSIILNGGGIYKISCKVKQ